MTTQTQTSLQLDPFTLKVLSNFSSINNGIVIKAGSEIRTMTESKTVLAEVIVPDTFPVDFAIYDLRQMLNFVSSLFTNPTLEFSDKYMTLASGNDLTKIFYCNADLISTPSKRITMPSEDIVFELSQDTIHKITKSSSILGADDLLFTSNGSSVDISVLDKTNSSTNTWSTTTPAKFTDDFSVYLKISNLKMLDGDYSVTISKKGITRFKHMRNDLKYFIATEADSKI